MKIRRQELDNSLIQELDKIGILTDLKTDNKDNLVDAINENTDKLIDADPTPLTLSNGTHVYDVSRVSRFGNVRMKGRTLINLLGRDGNCEDVNVFSSSANAPTVDSTVKKYGERSIKVAPPNNQTSFFHKTYPIDHTKKYIMVADMYVQSSSGGQTSIRAAKNDFTPIITVNADSSKLNQWQTVFARVDPSSITDGLLRFVGGQLNPVGASVGNIDGIRIYEITQDEYNAIDTMTPEQIAAKYPYFDDMKSIYAPYVIRYGENLWPDFGRGWGFNSNRSKVEMVNSYEIKVTITEAGGSQNEIDIYDLIPGETYTLSGISDGGSNTYFGVISYDRNGVALQDIKLFGSDSSITFTVHKDAVKTRLRANVISTALPGGIYILKKPMLTLGAEPKPFVPREDNHLYFPELSLASNVGQTVYDEMYEQGGQYWKLKKFETLDLNKGFDWKVYESGTSFKVIGLQNTFKDRNVSIYPSVVKYDGKPMRIGAPSTEGADVVSSGAWNNAVPPWVLLISIFNTDSGWGQDYTPSTDEIKAYFNGWKMYQAGSSGATPYTSGEKWWAKIYCGQGTNNGNGVVSGSGTLTYPTTMNDMGYTPYRIQYQLAQPVVEPVKSIGSISFHEGLNQVEVGAGLVYREKANPMLTTSGFYTIGDTRPNTINSLTRYRVEGFKNVYRNGKSDKLWSKVLDSNAYGKERIAIPAFDYDPSAAYEVDYLALDLYTLGFAPESIQGEYTPNLKETVDDLVRSGANIETRVSVLEQAKAEKVQGQWITPTLLNGWVNYEPTNGWSTAGYLKDELEFVNFKGVITGGSVAVGTVLFRLAEGCRPMKRLIFSVDSGKAHCRVDVTPNGEVVVVSGGNSTDLSLSNIRFLAEQ